MVANVMCVSGVGVSLTECTAHYSIVTPLLAGLHSAQLRVNPHNNIADTDHDHIAPSHLSCQCWVWRCHPSHSQQKQTTAVLYDPIPTASPQTILTTLLSVEALEMVKEGQKQASTDWQVCQPAQYTGQKYKT